MAYNKEYQRRWRIKHREHYNAIQARYRAKHREKAIHRYARWQKWEVQLIMTRTFEGVESLNDVAISLLLRRSVQAIQMKRTKEKNKNK